MGVSCEAFQVVVDAIKHQRRFFANARPEWDLRYFSNSSALYLSGKAHYQTSCQGLNFAVCGFTGIMFRYPPLQIRSCSDIFLFGKIDAADDVDVPHGRSRADGTNNVKIWRKKLP
jgi:hypothetical protein